MSEFENSHHLHFLFYCKTKCEFQFEIDILCPKLAVSSNSGQQSQPFYFKTAHRWAENSCLRPLSLFQTEIGTLFCSKTGSEDDENFHFAILKLDVSSKPKIQFREES